MLLRPRKWPKYNAAQVHEPENFPKLLHELCAGISEPPQPFGRPAFAIADMLFTMVSKVYSNQPARKFVKQLERSHKARLISRVPCYNSILPYFDLEQ